jgi:hypothetical protein
MTEYSKKEIPNVEVCPNQKARLKLVAGPRGPEPLEEHRLDSAFIELP